MLKFPCTEPVTSIRTALATKYTDKNYPHLLPEATSAEAGGGKNTCSGAVSQSSCPESSQDLCLPGCKSGRRGIPQGGQEDR